MKTHHKILLGTITGLSVISGVVTWYYTTLHVEAAPPASKYALGETLNPTCAPGTPNCTVIPPAASGDNGDITDLHGITQDITLPQKLGIGADPGEKLQVQNGNILMSSAAEQELQFHRAMTFPDPTNPGVAPDHENPVFKLGRIIIAGVGSPIIRFMYQDSVTPEKSVFEIEDTGTVASVRSPGVPGSHFEGFFAGDSVPLFRLNSYPMMQLEFGAGGASNTDVFLKRFIDTGITNLPGWLLNVNGNDKVRVTNNGLGVNTTAVDASFVSGGAIALHNNNELIQNIPNGGMTITPGDRSFLRLKSDCAVAANCTFSLNPGTFGQFLTLQWDDPTDLGTLQDAGFVKLSTDWTPNEFDTLSLIDTYDEDTGSHYWVEISRSAN